MRDVVGVALQSLDAKDDMFHDACMINLPTANGVKPFLLSLGGHWNSQISI